MMTMYFLFSPLWGKLCTYMPTRKVLLICAQGYAIGQIFFGMAHTEAAVVLGRMFAGIFTGGVFTAMANYVVNITGDDAKQRGENLVILTTLQSVGGACGYFVGGMLGMISVETAFIAQVAVLSLGGILAGILCLDDTAYKKKPERALRLRDVNPFAAMMQARHFMTPLLALVFAITAISAIGQNSYEQCFNYFIKDQYGMSSAYNGIFKAVIAGLTLALNGTVAMYLQKKTDINRTFLYILITCTVLISLILINRNQILFIAVYMIYSAVMSMRLPLLQTMASTLSDVGRSNEVMGFYQAMNSLGGIFGALFAGLIYAANPLLPFMLAFAAFAISTVIGLIYQKTRKLSAV